MQGHIVSVHEGKQPFKCDICDANFTQKPNLKQPIESDDEGKKPFKCDMCDASFAFKHHLQAHVTINQKIHYLIWQKVFSSREQDLSSIRKLQFQDSKECYFFEIRVNTFFCICFFFHFSMQ